MCWYNTIKGTWSELLTKQRIKVQSPISDTLKKESNGTNMRTENLGNVQFEIIQTTISIIA